MLVLLGRLPHPLSPFSPSSTQSSARVTHNSIVRQVLRHAASGSSRPRHAEGAQFFLKAWALVYECPRWLAACPVAVGRLKQSVFSPASLYCDIMHN